VTNCRPEYEQRTLCGALVVTLAMLLRLINCRFIIIIINSEWATLRHTVLERAVS